MDDNEKGVVAEPDEEDVESKELQPKLPWFGHVSASVNIVISDKAEEELNSAIDNQIGALNRKRSIVSTGAMHVLLGKAPSYVANRLLRSCSPQPEHEGSKPSFQMPMARRILVLKAVAQYIDTTQGHRIVGDLFRLLRRHNDQYYGEERAVIEAVLRRAQRGVIVIDPGYLSYSNVYDYKFSDKASAEVDSLCRKTEDSKSRPMH